MEYKLRELALKLVWRNGSITIPVCDITKLTFERGACAVECFKPHGEVTEHTTFVVRDIDDVSFVLRET